MSRLRTDLVRHFDEVPVRIAKIERTERPARAGLVDWTELDLHRAISEMGRDLVERRVRGEADVDRAGLRLPRLWLELASRLVKIELLIAESSQEGQRAHRQDGAALLERASAPSRQPAYGSAFAFAGCLPSCFATAQ